MQRQIPVIVMGVSGAGKTTLGTSLANRIDRPFIDTDDLHSEANRAKMRAGVALSDEDRLPWLRRIVGTIAQAREAATAPILACSALKASYRHTLRDGAGQLAVLYLAAHQHTVAARLAERSHAYMPHTLLQSQFDTLEPPVNEPDTCVLDARAAIETLTDQAAAWLHTLEAADAALTETR